MKRVISILIPSLLFVVTLILTFVLTNNSNTLSDYQGLPYVLLGISCGGFGLLISNLLNLRFEKKHPKEAKQKSMEVMDERNQMIQNHSKAKGYNFFFYATSALLLYYTIIPAGIAVVIPLLIVYLTSIGYRIYSQVKLNQLY